MPTAEPDVGIDLVPAELLAPRVRRVAAFSAAIGLIIGAAVGLFAGWLTGVLVGLVVGAPTALAAVASLRRRMVVSGTVVRSRHVFGTKHVDLARAETAELLVRSGRVSQISLRVSDGARGGVVPLAMYTDTGGRELQVLGLRRLADGLAGAEIVAAAAISSVLVEQLRAEARDAGMEERPLYRAVRLVRERGRTTTSALGDSEVAALLQS